MRRRPEGRVRAILAALLLTLYGHVASAETIETVTEDSSYSYMQDGKVGGAAGRIVEAVLKQAGLNDYHMAIYPWARAYDRALREPNVIIYPILRSQDREELFKWVGHLDWTLPILYKLRAAPPLRIAMLQDAKAYRVGVLRDDYREKYLHDQGFTRLVVAASNQENFNRLLNGQVQLVAMPERDARKFCADAQVPFETLEKAYAMDDLTRDIYIAFSRATSDELVDRVRAAYEQLQRAGVLQRLLQDQP
jgi:polar amino acid transport system substrate-binding protein